ncbi:MAG: c-type cytochrome [Bacteroidetes bacterium]|nr:c-type cytochrome [Bacteroidota bacterium]
MKKILKTLLFIIAGLVVVVAILALYVKMGLPNVGKPADLKVEATPKRVSRGEYLAKSVAGCMICHSERNFALYGGPVKENSLGMGGELFGRDQGFPGNIYAPNLTPYALGKWTDGELFRAITTGVSRDGRALFPIMNYPAYGKMDQEDVFSIIAYLRTLKPIEHDVQKTELDFPLNFIVNTIPAKATLMPIPDSNNAIAYGQYLVRTASCVECHSKAEKGKIVAGSEFGGGREFASGDGKVLYSANITPDKETGIGNWTRELFIRRFKQYSDSGYQARPVAAGEFNTAMPWMAYTGMRESDLAAIYAYLHSVKPISNAVKKLPGQ